jgi:hypothetical protein
MSRLKRRNWADPNKVANLSIVVESIGDEILDCTENDWYGEGVRPNLIKYKSNTICETRWKITNGKQVRRVCL